MENIDIGIQLKCVVWFLLMEGTDEQNILARIKKVYSEKVTHLNILNTITRVVSKYLTEEVERESNLKIEPKIELERRI